MALDLYIEVFSVDLCRNLWNKLGLKKITIPRLKNYDTVSEQNTCSEAVIHAVLCRRTFFQPYISKEICDDYVTYSTSNLDSYFYLKNNMDNYFPYKELKIFDKLLMVASVVYEMGLACHLKSDDGYLYNCPLSFAMYFDTDCKEEFYNEGGWREFELNALNYQARILIQPYNEKNVWCSKSACAEAMCVEYSLELITEAFREKMASVKSSSCPQCLPLFHAVNMVLDEYDELFTGYQITESFLQLILRMLSLYELQNGDQHFLEGSDFKSVEEVMKIVNSYVNSKLRQKELESDEYKKCNKLLEKFQIQNSHVFLSRLFKEHNDADDTSDRCMFCARKESEVPKVSKSACDTTQIERIKSVIYDTVTDVHLKAESAEVIVEAVNKKNPVEKEDKNVKDTLKLFLSLGTQPLTKDILKHMKRRDKNKKNFKKLADSIAKMQIEKAAKDEAKNTSSQPETKEK